MEIQSNTRGLQPKSLGFLFCFKNHILLISLYGSECDTDCDCEDYEIESTYFEKDGGREQKIRFMAE